VAESIIRDRLFVAVCGECEVKSISGAACIGMAVQRHYETTAPVWPS
jgi:hypothetical protein